MNHPQRIAAADYKLAQLALAQRLGLGVLATLVTNDPDEAREFITGVRGDVLFKTLRWTPYTRDGVPVTGWAAPVSAEEIDESVRVTPHLFQARSQAVVPVAGDLSARTAYADSERETTVPPTLLDDWMPAFLAQLAAPGAHLVRAARSGGTPLLYLFDPDRESFAEFIAHDGRWTVRQGGPVPLWDRIEAALAAWEAAGQPGIDSVRLRVTRASHHYWVEGAPGLAWEHRLD